MIAQLLCFLFGAALASAWWSIAVIPPEQDGRFVIPILATIAFIALFVCWCIAHIDK